MMKKIIAGAAAAILAVSTLATAAFAADVEYTYATPATTQYNAVATGSKLLESITDTYHVTFEIIDGANDKVVAATVKLTNIAGKTATQTLDKAGIIDFTTDDGEAFVDLPSTATSGNAVKAEITLTIKSTVNNDKYEKDVSTFDGTVKYIIGSSAASAGGPNVSVTPITVTEVKDNTSNTNEIGTFTFDNTAFKVADRAAMKEAEKAVLTLTFNKTSTIENGLVTLNVNGTKVDATVVGKVGSVDFELPIDTFYNADYEVFEDPIFTWTIAAGEATAATAAKLVFVAGAEAEETTTVAEEEVTTTEAPAADETTTEAEAEATTAADGAADGKGDNTNTGVALAVIPAIIAGAAVVVSRKRK